MTPQPVFVDASAWVAIMNKKDRHHGASIRAYRRLLQSLTPLMATTWTAYEALTLVKARVGYSQAERLWELIQRPAVVNFVRIDDDVEAEALDLFWEYKDKDWGVVDCTSFVVMERMNCRHAFAFDRHFLEASQQYGFSLVRT